MVQYKEPTNTFLCPLSANSFGIEFGSFRIRDLESQEVLFEVKRDPFSTEIPEVENEDDLRSVYYHFGPDFLNLKCVGTTLEFGVGEEPVENFR